MTDTGWTPVESGLGAFIESPLGARMGGSPVSGLYAGATSLAMAFIHTSVDKQIQPVLQNEWIQYGWIWIYPEWWLPENQISPNPLYADDVDALNEYMLGQQSGHLQLGCTVMGVRSRGYQSLVTYFPGEPATLTHDGETPAWCPTVHIGNAVPRLEEPPEHTLSPGELRAAFDGMLNRLPHGHPAPDAPIWLHLPVQHNPPLGALNSMRFNWINAPTNTALYTFLVGLLADYSNIKFFASTAFDLPTSQIQVDAIYLRTDEGRWLDWIRWGWVSYGHPTLP